MFHTFLSLTLCCACAYSPKHSNPIKPVSTSSLTSKNPTFKLLISLNSNGIVWSLASQNPNSNPLKLESWNLHFNHISCVTEEQPHVAYLILLEVVFFFFLSFLLEVVKVELYSVIPVVTVSVSLASKSRA